MNLNKPDIKKLMNNKNYFVNIDSPYITYHYKDLEDIKFTLNYNDIKGYFKKEIVLVNFLINRYENIHGEEIKRIEKVNFRNKRLNDILNKN